MRSLRACLKIVGDEVTSRPWLNSQLLFAPPRVTRPKKPPLLRSPEEGEAGAGPKPEAGLSRRLVAPKPGGGSTINPLINPTWACSTLGVFAGSARRPGHLPFLALTRRAPQQYTLGFGFTRIRSDQLRALAPLRSSIGCRPTRRPSGCEWEPLDLSSRCIARSPCTSTPRRAL